MSALLDTARAEIEALEQRLGILREIEQLAVRLAADGGGGAGTNGAVKVAVGETAGASPATPSRPTKRAAAHPHASRAAARNGHGGADPPQRSDGPHPKSPAFARRREAQIVALLRERGEMAPRDIARHLGTGADNLSPVLRRLRESGVVYAEGAKTDRRYGLTAIRDEQIAADPRNSAQKGRDRARVRREIARLVADDPGALNEERLTQALRTDREDVALICGELLVDGRIALNPDGTYSPAAA